MKTLLLSAFVALTHFCFGQHTYDWGYSYEALDGRESIGCDLNVDWENNILTLATFTGEIDADPSSNSLFLNANGDHNLLLQKISPSGTIIWSKMFPGNFYDFEHKITTNSNGDILICGSFLDSIDCDPGLDTNLMIAGGNRDAYIIKLDKDGDFIWSRQFDVSGPNSAQMIDCVLSDNGEVFATGHFTGPTNFGQSVLNTNGRSVFILKLDATGNVVWVNHYGNSSELTSHEIIRRQNGNILMGFNLRGSISLDGGITLISSFGNEDVLLVEFDTAGNNVNYMRFSGTQKISLGSLNEDSHGNIIVSGTFEGTMDVDPGPATNEITAQGDDDAFFVKLNPNGELIWVSSLHSVPKVNSQVGQSIAFTTDAAVDAYNNLYFVGGFTDSLIMSTTLGTIPIVTPDWGDGFIVHIDHQGNIRWGGSTNAGFLSAYYGVALDQNNNVYGTGIFYGSIDFDPGASNEIYTGNGNDQSFFQKLNPPAILSVAEIVEHSVSIYPNPSYGIVNIAIDAYQESIGYELSNLNGQLVDSGKLRNVQEAYLELPERTGIYLLKLYFNDGPRLFRIVRE